MFHLAKSNLGKMPLSWQHCFKSRDKRYELLGNDVYITMSTNLKLLSQYVKLEPGLLITVLIAFHKRNWIL